MVKTVFKATRSKAKPSYSVEVEASDFVFEEGDLGMDMFIIQEGQVEISKNFKGETRKLAVLGQGDFFGEMSILEDLPRTASATAKTDCSLLRINGSTFDQMLRKNPEIAVRMLRKLSRRLRDTDQMLRDALGSEEIQAPEMPVPDVPKERALGQERLEHVTTGMEFFLAAGEETTVGRRDPVTGINPDIDLTSADTQRSISRRHALILRRDHLFFVREEVGTMNGTFVNGKRVETGIEQEFRAGDEVRFGLVKTRFTVD